jgi:hypothetical protein
VQHGSQEFVRPSATNEWPKVSRAGIEPQDVGQAGENHESFFVFPEETLTD